MAADKLVPAVLAEIILFAVAFFPVPGYAGATATGHLTSMVIRMTS
jgi:hypothetical protein